jgi:hypothetical protein
MHVHISWAVALIYVLTYIAVIGAINMLARRSSGRWASGWRLVATPN